VKVSHVHVSQKANYKPYAKHLITKDQHKVFKENHAVPPCPSPSCLHGNKKNDRDRKATIFNC
jgi:hypothetical protein